VGASSARPQQAEKDRRMRHGVWTCEHNALTTARFVRFLLFLALAIGLAGAGADGDLWGHVRFGQDVLASHHVALPDTHSFTADKAWINHEWLAEVAMASAFGAAGPLGLNLLRIACLGAIVALIWRRVSRFRPPNRILDALVVVATLGVYVRAQHVRPQMFSLLLFALLLTVLTDVDRTGDRKRLLFIPPLMALWANVHGGWIVGVECLGAWAGYKLLFARGGTRERATSAALILVAVAATAANPYGVGLWRFLFETVRVGRPYIEEWQPVYRLQGAAWLFWLLPASLAIVAAIRSKLRLDPAAAIVVLFLAITSLLVSRLDAFFTLAVVFLLAEPLAAGWAERSVDSEPQRPVRYLRPAMALLLLAAVPWVAIRAERIRIGQPPMPEREAAAFVAERGLHGRVLVWFDWGEYVIWHFSPQLRVSIDGRRETVYSDRLIEDHMAFYLGGAPDLPARIAADYIWLPKWLPVVAKLRGSGWTPLFEGPESIILCKGGSEIRQLTVVAVNDQLRAFPGP
jgi:hypothetical protein